MKQMQNMTIRDEAKQRSIRLWEIADKLGISEATMVRKLRKELPQEEKDKILAMIDKLAKERQEVS